MFRWQTIRRLSAICVCVSLPQAAAAATHRSEMSVTIDQDARKRLLVAHVDAAARRVTANGVAMTPGSPRQSTRHAVDRAGSARGARTYWLDLDAADPGAFSGGAVVVALATDGGFASLVAELVEK